MIINFLHCFLLLSRTPGLPNISSSTTLDHLPQTFWQRIRLTGGSRAKIWGKLNRNSVYVDITKGQTYFGEQFVGNVIKCHRCASIKLKRVAFSVADECLSVIITYQLSGWAFSSGGRCYIIDMGNGNFFAIVKHKIANGQNSSKSFADLLSLAHSAPNEASIFY